MKLNGLTNARVIIQIRTAEVRDATEEIICFLSGISKDKKNVYYKISHHDLSECRLHIAGNYCAIIAIKTEKGKIIYENQDTHRYYNTVHRCVEEEQQEIVLSKGVWNI